MPATATVTAIRTALANQIQAYCVNPPLRAQAEPLDSGVGPVALVLPSNPFVVYGETFMDTFSDTGLVQTALTLNLQVLILISDSSTADREQQQLDAFLGIGLSSQQVSVPMAIQSDPSLGGVVMSCIPTQVTHYGRIEYGDVTYFGARINVQVYT